MESIEKVMIEAQKLYDEDQAAFTTQVQWFVDFFTKWLQDNPERIE